MFSSNNGRNKRRGCYLPLEGRNALFMLTMINKSVPYLSTKLVSFESMNTDSGSCTCTWERHSILELKSNNKMSHQWAQTTTVLWSEF